jgi:hypothetical protein
MYTALFFVYGLLQLGLFVWLLRLWRETREPIALVLILPQFFLIWDNWRVAAGPLLGFGDLLYWLSWPSFWIHWFAGCWLIIAAGALLRLAGFGFAQSKWGMGAFCLLAVALMLHDLPNFWTKDIYPVCEHDLIRYGGSVTEANRCSPDQALAGSREFPLAPVVTCFVLIGAGLILWIRRGFPWLFLGSFLMLISATPPFAKYKLDNLGEVLIKGGAFWALWHFTRAQRRAPGRPAVVPGAAATT